MAPDAALTHATPPEGPADAVPAALRGNADLALMARATAEAGRIALAHFGRDPRTWTKGDASPVSEADIAVDRFLRETLTNARPDYGWLSEETADGAERLSREHAFVVDPIDGTKAFLAGKDSWVVSVALVTRARPRAAVLLRPVTGETYLAVAGRGAFRDGRRLALSPACTLRGARVSGPRSVLGGASADKGGPLRLVSWIPSLALRLAMVAGGELDAVVTKGGSSDWDLAAADLVVQEAGGELATGRGHRPAYNRPETRHGPLVASRPGLSEGLRAIVEAATAA